MNHTLVQHFARLYDHRTSILEGVRAVAFRNINHFDRAMKREGIDRFTTPASILCVQDAMVRDQDLEPTPIHRWLLAWGTFNAWEVYLCLLLAEVESYRSTRDSFTLPPLDTLIHQNASVLEALKTLRDKLLHPTKDVPYEKTLTEYFREIERRYPLHYRFAEDLQTLLDQYLRDLKEHLGDAFADDLGRLPDNQLHAFLTQEARDLRHALAQAESTIDKKAIEDMIREHNEFASKLRLDPDRRKVPLDPNQRKQIHRLYTAYKTLRRIPPFPSITDHSSTAVQAPMHDQLSSCIPIPSEPDTKGFYRGSLLPSSLLRFQSDHATLVFRSTLLYSESLHHTEALLRNSFPGKSHSEILNLKDWETQLQRPITPEDIAASQKRTSPGMVALALLADPLRVYRNVVSASPGLSVAELDRVATGDHVAKLSAWRNTIFHVPRGSDPYQLERQFRETSLGDAYMALVSGLWRFFLRGDRLLAAG